MGLVSARKAGILASTGKYIGYVDGDDWIGPGFFQSLLHSIEETDADIAIAGFSRDLFSSSKSILNTLPSGVYENEGLIDIYKQMLSSGDFYEHGITTYLWNKLFKREVLIENQLAVDDRITIGEDAAVVYKAILKSKRIIITDNCAYHYRQREDSMLKTSRNFSDEYRHLKYLNDYMQKSFSDENQEYNLTNQLQDFITATYIIRSGGCVYQSESMSEEFPYSGKFEGKKVIVYGAGTFGQQLVKRLRYEQTCEIVGWVDSDYWEYRRCCMDVDPIERVCDEDYDYILIAMLSPTSIKLIKEQLRDYGVSKDKIVSIQVTPSQIIKAYQIFISNS